MCYIHVHTIVPFVSTTLCRLVHVHVPDDGKHEDESRGSEPARLPVAPLGASFVLQRDLGFGNSINFSESPLKISANFQTH